SGKPIILISDGHLSHETPEMHILAFNNDIILYVLPPHTTHKLQPLDVGVFGPFQKHWLCHCEDSAIRGSPVTRHNVVEHYMEIRNKHLTANCIQAAFKHSGMWPIDRSVFDDTDYATACTFQAVPTVPFSYPRN
ncbi:hypothetical protein M422DRAFT_125614, partial [Sphaerobolus stellatus SS14]